MSVKNTQKTVKKIWKNTENTKGFANFTPNWNLVFTDGTEAKINLEKYGHLCEKIQEGKSYLFTLEDGVTEAGKAWVAVRDVLASGGMPPATTPSAPSAPGPKPPEKPSIEPVVFGNRLNNATQLIVSLINAGKVDMGGIPKKYDEFFNLFAQAEKTGKFEIEF